MAIPLHDDHDLTPEHTTHVDKVFPKETGFHLLTVEMPEGLPDLPNGLYGPTCGDDPVPEDQVSYVVRGDRDWEDRVTDKPRRPSRKLTMIGSREWDDSITLYTAHGGPPAAQNPADPSCGDQEESKAFWATHALVK